MFLKERISLVLRPTILLLVFLLIFSTPGVTLAAETVLIDSAQAPTNTLVASPYSQDLAGTDSVLFDSGRVKEENNSLEIISILNQVILRRTKK